MSVHGDDSPQSKLSDRELVVFKKLAQGLTNTEIAQELGLSTKTIGLITQAVRESLGITRAADLTRLALRHQLIEE
jgi:DNA-binding NarL/FixJ family response regulator